MAQLVSDFLITPVLRQARRFSAGFASSETPAIDIDRPAHEHHRRASSAGPSARESALASTIVDVDELAALSIADRPPDLSPTTASSPDPRGPNPVLVLSRPNTTPDAAGPPPGPLPEDDGMGDLRRRIQAIQQLDAPQEEKARMMHSLFIEKYTRAHGSHRGAQNAMRPVSPPSPIPLETRETTTHTGPLSVLKMWNPLGESSGPLDLPLTDADRAPTYVPQKPPPPPDETQWWSTEEAGFDDDDGEERQLGCEHYRRNVKLQCADCERWYTCRYCHDAVEDHVLPRQKTKHMLCVLCGCAQKASGSCIKCGQQSVYYCGICKLWNDDPNRPIYHCPDCGMCRIGQGLNKDFFHCKKCMACISMSRVNGHRCVERATDSDCPICGEYLFSSPRPVTLMQCGHSIHAQCFEELQKTSYRCPLCNKSCINMESRFRQLDMEILHQPMPVDYANARAVITCNDCRAKSETPYHWLGLKCAVCGSYNTNQLQLLNMPGGDSSGGQDQGHANRPRHEPVALDPAIVAEEMRRRIRASRRAMARRGSEGGGTSSCPSFGFLSSSPSSYSAAFLARFLSRSSTAPASSSTMEQAARPVSSSSSCGPEATAAAAPIKQPTGGRSITDQPRHATCSSDSGQKTTEDVIDDDDDDDEDDDADDDMLDIFGTRDRDFDLMTGLTSAESAVGFDDDEEEEEEEEESSDEEEDDAEEEEDEDEEDDILLVGHR
ncbi:hypothetical protein VTJ49DRAFT_4350 [Mycothermus thermophilus]|uniref:Zf-CHY-domain-containing protein n=1 Tax=Humicola insolens TaxID=85995 RepID=A0ABR3V6E7_HUMIN